MHVLCFEENKSPIKTDPVLSICVLTSVSFNDAISRSEYMAPKFTVCNNT